jgi:hypothetical protein
LFNYLVYKNMYNLLFQIQIYNFKNSYSLSFINFHYNINLFHYNINLIVCPHHKFQFHWTNKYSLKCFLIKCYSSKCLLIKCYSSKYFLIQWYLIVVKCVAKTMKATKMKLLKSKGCWYTLAPFTYVCFPLVGPHFLTF